MSSIFQDKKIIVCIGSGGVGKTTVAAALGTRAAEQGLKVLVLTIDPSRRLAQVLGIADQTAIVKVPGQNFSGELWASVIHHKKVFDDFVLKSAGGPEKAERILKNRLYQQLSTSLSGSQEFTSLEMLYSCFESDRYDLIILDTPPAKHALDFLKAPQKLAALFSEGIAQWFRELRTPSTNIFKSFLHSGTKQALKVLETLTGSQFIQELADFFMNIENWQRHLEQRIIETHRLLMSTNTDFFLVTSFDEVKLQEAQDLAREINKSGYHLSTVLLNRAFPDWTLPDPQELSGSAEDQEMARLAGLLKKFYDHRLEIYRSFERKLSGEVNVFKIPEYKEPIHDLDGLKALGRLIGDQGSGV